MSIDRGTPLGGGSRARRILGLLAIVGLVSAACGGDDESTAATTTPPQSSPADDNGAFPPEPLPKRATVKIGVAGFQEPNLPYHLADELGEFEKENIDAEITVIEPTDAAALLARGELDVVPGSLSPGYLNLLSEGAGFRAVLPFYEFDPDSGAEIGLWVRNDALGDDGFQGSDLVGLRVLHVSGAASTSVNRFYEEVLEPEGIEPSEILLERLPPPDMPAALINGAAPAAFVMAPFYEQLEGNDCCEFIGYWPEYPISQVFLAEQLLNEDREIGLAVTRAIMRTQMTYLQGEYTQNPEVADFMVEKVGITRDQLDDWSHLYWNPEFDLAVDTIVDVQDYFFALGDVLSYPEDERLTADDMFDTSILEELLAEG
jgi:NitT/TauT family transport system substrate-binding protein